MPPGEREPQREAQRGLSRAFAKVGVGVSALAVFTCGFLAMRATAWPRILFFSALALVACVIASAFSRRSR